MNILNFIFRPWIEAAALAKTVKKLLWHNRVLRDMVGIKDDEPVKIKSMKFDNIGITATLEHTVTAFLASEASQLLKDSFAENYIEIQAHHRQKPFEQFTITIQRTRGKTPHQLRREAEEWSEVWAQRFREATKTIDYFTAKLRAWEEHTPCSDSSGDPCVDPVKVHEFIQGKFRRLDAFELTGWCCEVCGETHPNDDAGILVTKEVSRRSENIHICCSCEGSPGHEKIMAEAWKK